jgi:hypothetical protein
MSFCLSLPFVLIAFPSSHPYTNPSFHLSSPGLAPISTEAGLQFDLASNLRVFRIKHVHGTEPSSEHPKLSLEQTPKRVFVSFARQMQVPTYVEWPQNCFIATPSNFSLYLSIYLSIYLSVCLSVCLAI